MNRLFLKKSALLGMLATLALPSLPAQGCAPSVQLARGSAYEASNIVAALKHGYAVLDLFKAAPQTPASGVSSTAKAAIWGY